MVFIDSRERTMTADDMPFRYVKESSGGSDEVGVQI